MAKGRTLTLKVDTDVKGVDKLDTAGKKVSKFGAALTLGVTAPLAVAGIAAFKFASDIEESTTKAATVFGDSIGKIDAVAGSLTDAFDEATFRDTAGTFGALLKNIGFTQDAAADLSVQWLQLAQDMASFHNVDVEQALGAVQSALAGEFEPLKQFGVQLNESTIKAKALELGLIDAGEPVDTMTRALVVNNELFAQQADVVGDFERTADGAANKTRILLSNLKDSAAQLGEKLLPLGIEFLEVANDLATGFADLDETTQQWIISIGLAAAALGPILGIFGNLLRLAKGIQTAAPWLLAAAPLAGMVALKEGGDEATEALFGDRAIFGSAGRNAVDQLFSGIELGAQGASASFDGPRESLAEFSDEVLASQGAWTSYQEAVSGAMDTAVGNVATGVDDMAEEIAASPQEMADALLDNQFKLTDAVDVMNAALKESLSPAVQAFNAQGFLNSDAYKEGIASGDPAVRAQALALGQAAEDAIAANSLYDAGRSFSFSFAYGMDDPAAMGAILNSATKVALAARGIFPGSEPKDPNSPFRGITDAFGMMDTLAAGIAKNDDVVPDALRNALRVDMAPVLDIPRPARSGAIASVLSGAGGGPTVNLTVQGDLKASERTLPGIVVSGLYAAGFDK